MAEALYVNFSVLASSCGWAQCLDIPLRMCAGMIGPKGDVGLAKRDIRTFVLQRYWRATRALTMGAQGVVVDAEGRVLLVRHGYRPGWHFPGGGVERNETVEHALERELKEEAGVVFDGPPELLGIFSNFAHFKSDHIALYIVRSWHQPAVPAPNWEIAEQLFFAVDALPQDTHIATKRRIDEIFSGCSRALSW